MWNSLTHTHTHTNPKVTDTENRLVVARLWWRGWGGKKKDRREDLSQQQEIFQRISLI